MQQQRQHYRHHQMMEEMEALDSCHGNIRYQAVEGLVQTARPQVRTTAFRREGHYSSVEDLLDDGRRRPVTSPDRQQAARNRMQRAHYGSTESINSLGSNGGNAVNPSRTTQTPTSMYSFEDTEEDRRRKEVARAIPAASRYCRESCTTRILLGINRYVQ